MLYLELRRNHFRQILTFSKSEISYIRENEILTKINVRPNPTLTWIELFSLIFLSLSLMQNLININIVCLEHNIKNGRHDKGV